MIPELGDEKIIITADQGFMKKFCKRKFTYVAFSNKGPVHSAYNPSFSACFFSRNSIFLSQQISQQCFSAGLSAQPNGSKGLSILKSYKIPMEWKSYLLETFRKSWTHH
jgi:hypothetical protein